MRLRVLLEDAISMSAKLQPDLVVLDDQMPILTGPDAVVAKGLHPAELIRVIAAVCGPTPR